MSKSQTKKPRETDAEVLSRRTICKAAATIAVGFLSPSATAVPVRSPVCYGKPAAGVVELNDTTIYPLLAVWLYVTTNKDFKLTSAQLAAQVDLTDDCVKKILARRDSQASAFNTVMTVFQNVVQDLSPVGAPYSGGHCPSQPPVVTKVSSL